MESEHEYAIHLSSGRIFYTGGFESLESLTNIVHNGRPIAGTFGRDATYYETALPRAHVVAIMDIRGPVE